MTKAIFKLGNHTNEGDWEGQYAMAEAHDGETCEVLCVACEVDGTFEHDYHDLKFADGVILHAVSGFHLTLI